jgi:hypothetical protein
MNTRNVVHSNGRASLHGQTQMPSGGAPWTDTTRPTARTGSTWREAAWTKVRSVTSYSDNETHEDEDPSLWHD